MKTTAGYRPLSMLIHDAFSLLPPPPAVVEDYLTAEHLEIPNFLPPDGLHPTIYASQEGSINWPLGAKKDVVKMLSVAIKINLDLEKNIKVS